MTLKGFFKMVILNKTRTLTSKNSKNKIATSVNQIDLSRSLNYELDSKKKLNPNPLFIQFLGFKKGKIMHIDDAFFDFFE